jgi:hypothetical protein
MAFRYAGSDWGGSCSRNHLRRKGKIIRADGGDGDPGAFLFFERETLVVDAGEPIVEWLALVTRFTGWKRQKRIGKQANEER